MKCQWNDDEDGALQGLPWLAQLIYLRGLRRFMDYRTGIVGDQRAVSYQSLREVGYIDHARGRSAAGDVSIKSVRVAIKNLINSGLLEPIEADRRLVFRCILADLDDSAKNKEGRRRADVGQTNEGRPEPSDSNASTREEGRRRADPLPPKEGNPQETGIRKERGVNTPVDLSAKRGADERVLTVFDYWRQVMAHPRAKLDAKRKKAIAARLRDGYSVEYIKSAIDGCKGSAYHQGKNAQHSIYDDIELICREASKLDRFANMASKAPQRDNELDEWINDDRIIEGNFNVIG